MPSWIAVAAFLLTVRSPRAQELLQNGGFEDGDAPWMGCGGVHRVERDDAGTVVRTGQHAAQIGGLSDDSCGNLPAPQFVIVQAVQAPADATALTLSFWWSRVGPDLTPEGNSLADLVVSFGTDPEFPTALFDVVSHNVLRGWMPFRGALSPDDVARFRGQTAYVHFAVRYTADTGVTYLLDDVSLAVGDVRTPAAPLPPALAGDGSRPLVLLQRNAANADGLTVVRLDTDGSKAQAVDIGLHGTPRRPHWSPDGSSIAVLDDDLSPPGAPAPARITRLSVLRPDGSGRREVFATAGLAGASGSPPGCRPPACTEAPSPALDQLIKSVDWSPDGRVLAVTICARNRYPWGETDDDLCHAALIDAATGSVVRDDLDGWWRPDWSNNGRLLFNGPTVYAQYAARGVWEADLSVTPATETLLLPAPLDLLVGGDRLPTWAPDGHHFVTAREIGGLHVEADGTVSSGTKR